MTPVPGAPAAAPLYAKMPMMAAYDWTGIYVGGHGSFDWAKTDITTTNTATGVVEGSASTSRSSAHGGGQIGFDYMMLTRVVIGFAADISTGDDITTTFSNAAGTNVHTEESKTVGSGSVRGRLGYAFANVLVYGTGGWAWTSGTAIRTQLVGKTGAATPGIIEQAPANLNGWVAGAGLAYGFWHNWEVFGEYRYTSYQAISIPFPVAARTTTFATSGSSVIAGLNFKFDPFVTRY